MTPKDMLIAQPAAGGKPEDVWNGRFVNRRDPGAAKDRIYPHHIPDSEQNTFRRSAKLWLCYGRGELEASVRQQQIAPRALCHAVIALLFGSLPVSGSTQGWVEVRSPHFVVVTDAGEKRGREVAMRFEQVRAAFGQVIYRNLKVSVPIPVEIIGFRNNKELRQFAPLWNGKPIELAGYFQQGEDRDFIALDLSSEAGWQVVFHEFTHLLLHANFSEIPVWFEEGFAEYFASLEVQGDTLTVGSSLRDRSYVLSQTRWMPVQALFSVTQNSPEYNEKGDHRSIFYAESWLVVHYIMGQRKMKETSEFMRLQVEHVPVQEAFQRAFGMAPGDFDKVLRQYFQGKVLYFKYPAPKGPELDSKSYSSRMLMDTESAAVLADMHLHERDYQDTAVKEFEEVLAKQPDNATAHRGLGYAYLRKGDFSKAEGQFEKAVAAGNAEAETHYLYALMLTRAARLTQASGESVQLTLEPVTASEKIPLMKKELQAAIALNPEYADAYNLLSLTQASEGDYGAAISSENRAFQLSHKEIYALNLAYFYARQQKWEDSEALLRQLTTSADQSIAAAARNNLEQLESYRKYMAARSSGAPAGTVPEERFRITRDRAPQQTATSPPPPVPPVVDFAKGKIVAVDCPDATNAIVTVIVGKKTWKMRTADRNKLVLINAGAFSCSWHDQPVAMNYTKTAEGEGKLMTLELP